MDRMGPVFRLEITYDFRPSGPTLGPAMQGLVRAASSPAAWRDVGWTKTPRFPFPFSTLSLSPMQDSQRQVSCPRPFAEPVTALPACGIDACRAISEANVTAAEGGGRTWRRTRTPGRARGLGRDGMVDGQTCSVADELIMQPHSLGGNTLRAVRNVMTFRP